MKPTSRNLLLVLLLLICAGTLLTIIGLTHFHTKGEPREAIVAVSMMQTDNWVLPENNGGDIAYKPPMFHWLIAATSVIFNGGTVNEYTSRFPSALAAIAIAITMFLFYSKRTNNNHTAFLSALLFLSAFEVHRGATAARVDMVLTAFIVLALFALYRWYEKGAKGFPLWAVLCMSAATLTKGPVGIVLPCLVTGVFMLLRREPFWRTCGKFVVIAVASCILPAVWYYAAYRQGGENFIALVVEENFGRFTGTMSYKSHDAPPFYYLYITLAGFLPWTLLVLFSLFALPYSRLKIKGVSIFKAIKEKIDRMDAVRLFSATAILIILFFYLIPESKRSVYILPVYPFIAYFLAEYMGYLATCHRNVWRAFGIVLSTLAGIFAVLFVALKCGWGTELLPADLRPYIVASWNFWDVVCLLVLVIFIYGLFKSKDIQSSRNRYAYSAIALFFWLQIIADTAVLPDILNVKSDYTLAQKVKETVPQGNIYSYVSVPMLHFFVINFYTDNRVVMFETEQPDEGYLLVGKGDFAYILSRYAGDYRFEEMWESERRGNDIRDIVCMYRFRREKETE